MIDGDGRYAVSVHYNITYKQLIRLGYSAKEADLMAHYSSTYADHPTEAVLRMDTYAHTGMVGIINNYRKGIDYSKTAQSQDEKNSMWHSMMSDAEADAGMTEEQALNRGLQFGWSNVFSSNGGENLEKFGQGVHALQDAIAHHGERTNDHLGYNVSSVKAVVNDLYGSTVDAGEITRSAGIITRLMGGKKVKFDKHEELNFKGMSSQQLGQSLKLLMGAGFQGTIKLN